MPTTMYDVAGMTCGHCARAVGDEVGGLGGVSAVDVDVDAGTITVTGVAERAEVAAAVDAAGYALTGVR